MGLLEIMGYNYIASNYMFVTDMNRVRLMILEVARSNICLVCKYLVETGSGA